MNYLWAFMILSGVIFSAFHGTIPAVTGAVLDSAKEAVTLCITMTGVMSFWMGLMRIAERGGVIAGLSRKLKPVLRFLFPQIPPGHVANEKIAANMIANIFGPRFFPASLPFRLLPRQNRINPGNGCYCSKRKPEPALLQIRGVFCQHQNCRKRERT